MINHNSKGYSHLHFSHYRTRDLDSLVREYRRGLADGHTQDHGELLSEIYRQAEMLAVKWWGPREATLFHSKKERELHEQCWSEFGVRLTYALREFDPSRNVSFSTYFARTIINEKKRGFLHITRLKRSGEPTTGSLDSKSGSYTAMQPRAGKTPDNTMSWCIKLCKTSFNLYPTPLPCAGA